VHRLGDALQGGIVEAEALQERLERAVVAMVREFDVGHVEWQSIRKLFGPAAEDEARAGIDEPANQPRRRDSIYLGTRAGQPRSAVKFFRRKFTRRRLT
jgi:hypothetical protein